jgi:gamma-glutamyltranspeptidase/glutathione hydrolase
MLNALRNTPAMPVPVPDPGRANAIACGRYLPGDEDRCNWATDSRGNGLAVGSN